jgi:anthranilate synthase component I
MTPTQEQTQPARAADLKPDPKPEMKVYFKSMTADLETPVSAYLKLAQGEKNSFLLESVEGGERYARYSFIGVGARGKMVARGHEVALEGSFSDPSGPNTHWVKDPLELLYHKVYAPVEVPDPLPHFIGGAVGYTSYDLIRLYETLPDSNPDELNLPDLQFFAPEGVVIFDHVKHVVFLVCTEENSSAGEMRAQDTLNLLERRLRGPLPEVPGAMPSSEKAEFVSNRTQAEFEAAVEKGIEYIRAGDIFQFVPSQRFTGPLTTHPFALYRALRQVNPSPYLGYLDFGDVQLVAGSPETLCRSTPQAGGKVKIETRPIAGTRKRGKTPQEDLALERELLADEKERAEHLMLLDLGRNDLGRIAEYGTVQVEDYFTIERYSHVMHIVSGVTATLAADKNTLDVLSSTLPMGTVSGAPKIRAMAIIDELETTRRGPYGGAFGYLAFDGSMDMALTLRTMVVTDGKVHIQTGGGVVFDSVPALEYQESLDKAAAMMRAVQMAEQGL